MPYIIMLKVRQFHYSSINRFTIAGKRPVGGHKVPLSLIRVKYEHTIDSFEAPNLEILNM